MIISIRDAQNRTIDGVAFTALISGMTSIGISKKTLAMQLTSSTEDSILNVLDGKNLKNSIQDIHSFQDEGLDSLFLRAETAELSKEHYDECVTPVENMLDVLKPTKKTEFKEIFSVSLLENIIKNSKECYSYVFIFLPNDDKELIDTVTAYTDEDLILIPQGKKQEVDLSNKKTYLVVKDFETTSKYDASSIKKKYGVKKLYPVMHNVGFCDAVNSENLLDYLYLNKSDLRSDDNYTFTASIKKLIERYVTDKEEVEEELDLPEKDNHLEFEAAKKEVIPEDAIQEVTVKKGLFGKKKTIMINM